MSRQYLDRITSHRRPNNSVYGRCKCGKNLTHYEFIQWNLCAECKFHQDNNTYTIEKYNEWLRKG